MIKLRFLSIFLLSLTITLALLIGITVSISGEASEAHCCDALITDDFCKDPIIVIH